VVERCIVHGPNLEWNLNWWKQSRFSLLQKTEFAAIACEKISIAVVFSKKGKMPSAITAFNDALILLYKAEQYQEIGAIIFKIDQMGRLIPVSAGGIRGKKGKSGVINGKSNASGRGYPSYDNSLESLEDYTKQISVDYFDKMNPAKYYPLELTISDIQVMKRQAVENIITRERLTQKQEEMQISTTFPYIIARPIFPGCDVVPPERNLDLTKEKETLKFFIVPRITGEIKSSVEFIDQNEKILNSIDLPVCVDDPRYAKAIAAYGMASSIVPKLLGFFGIDALNSLVMTEVLPAMEGLWGQISFTNFFAYCGLLITLLLSGVIYYTRKPNKKISRFSLENIREKQLNSLHSLNEQQQEEGELSLLDRRRLKALKSLVSDQNSEKSIEFMESNSWGNSKSNGIDEMEKLTREIYKVFARLSNMRISSPSDLDHLAELADRAMELKNLGLAAQCYYFALNIAKKLDNKEWISRFQTKAEAVLNLIKENREMNPNAF
jgi:hypothetical protein